jgi:hypothetical protein
MKTLLSMAAAWLVVSAVAAHAQSLGDLARKEEERRKTISAPAKVLTNEDLRGAAVAPPAPVVTPVAGGAPAAAVPPPSPSGGSAAADAPRTPTEPESAQAPASEDEWRKRIAAARDNLARSQTFIEALQSRINALSTDFAARDDPAQRAEISTNRQKALAELDRVKQEIQQYEKAITGIQDEARKAGVPAGWVR